MEIADVINKFGDDYLVNDDTFVMGIRGVFADHIASRFRGRKLVLDVCCGAGFMAMALAKVSDKIITVDINPDHLTQARHNAQKTGLLDKIEFVEADAIDPKFLASLGKIDAVFMDPDWAKPGDKKTEHTPRLSEMQPDANLLFELIKQKTLNIALRLPKEIDEQELQGYPDYEIERFVMNGKTKFFTCYFGELKNTTGQTVFEVGEES